MRRANALGGLLGIGFALCGPMASPAAADLDAPSAQHPASERADSDLTVLAERYRGVPPSTAPDVTPVRGIVDALVREQGAHPQSWWDAFKAWLRSVISGQDDHSFSWLERWLNKLATAAGVVSAVLYGLLMIALVAAAVFIVLELRAAGLFARRARNPAASFGPAAASSSVGDVFATLDSAAMLDRPAILLRLLVDGLAKHGRLQDDRHLTHRELSECARLDDGTQRGRFARVAMLAERLLYGRRPVPLEDVESVLADGRALLLQVDGSRSARD